MVNNPSDWDATGLCRWVTANDLAEKVEDNCILCRLPLQLGSSRMLPCGCIFDKKCLELHLDKDNSHPRCPNRRCTKSKKGWSIHVFPGFNFPTEEGDESYDGWGHERFRRFKAWIRWINEYDEEPIENTFSDLDSESEDECDSEYDQSVSNCQSDSDSDSDHESCSLESDCWDEE